MLALSRDRSIHKTQCGEHMLRSHLTTNANAMVTTHSREPGGFVFGSRLACLTELSARITVALREQARPRAGVDELMSESSHQRLSPGAQIHHHGLSKI
jgi:hypothetical protein